MFSWLAKWFTQKPAPDTPEPVPAPEGDDVSEYFSTHRTLARRENLQAYIEQNAFQVTASDFVATDGSAMDSGSNSDSAKNAFVLGQQRLPQNLFAWYVSQSFIGYQACALIAQQWLVDKGCSLKGRDAVRNWFEITSNDGTDIDPKVLKAIVKADKRYKLKKNLMQASKFNEVFGIRHVLFVVNSPDPEYYEKPFNPDGIAPNSYRGISQIDPHWITPLLDSAAVANPESLHFYEPTYWQVSGRKIHRSHFVILLGPEVADILKPSYIYGGMPMPQLVMERVYAAERTANEAPQLAMTKRLNVRHMDLAKAVANQQAFEETLAVQAEFRDNYGILAAGKDEEVKQLETSLTDLDEVIMTQYQIVAAVFRVPATKLLGTTPKGFNATGEYEESSYHEEVETVQEDLSPIVERHHICVMRSNIAPRFGGDPFEIEAEWNPVDAPTAKEQAEVNESKMRTAQGYQATGAIDAYEVRDRLTADKESGFNGLETVERPEELGDTELEPLGTDLKGSDEPAPETDSPPTAQDTAGQDVLRQEGRSWYVYSETGKKLGGPYSNRKKAANRLRQIEHFKREG